VQRPRNPTRQQAVLAVYLVVLAVAVLSPLPHAQPETLPQPPSLLGIGWLADCIRNLALFAPIGAMLVAAGRTTRSAIAIGLALSLAIEVVQLAIPGRFASPLDLVSNTLGTTLGVGLASGWRDLLYPSGKLATRLSLTASTASACLMLTTAWLFQPVFPDATYFGGWTLDLGHFELYSGRVLEARVGTLPIPAAGRVSDTPAFRQLLSADAPVLIRAIAGTPPSRLSALVTIHDEHQHEILLLGIEGEDFLIRRLLRAYHFGFENPALRAQSILEGLAPEEPFSLTIDGDGPRRQLTLTSAATRTLGWTPGRAWALLVALPTRWQPAARALDIGWIALLFFPAAFWARRRAVRWLGVGALFLTLAALPQIGGIGAVPLREWVAGGVGTWAGVYAARRACDRMRATEESDGSLRPD
jgi:VanZ family protein